MKMTCRGRAGKITGRGRSEAVYGAGVVMGDMESSAPAGEGEGGAEEPVSGISTVPVSSVMTGGA